MFKYTLYVFIYVCISIIHEASFIYIFKCILHICIHKTFYRQSLVLHETCHVFDVQGRCKDICIFDICLHTLVHVCLQMFYILCTHYMCYVYYVICILFCAYMILHCTYYMCLIYIICIQGGEDP